MDLCISYLLTCKCVIWRAPLNNESDVVQRISYDSEFQLFEAIIETADLE